jgi:hypothetical protein
MWVTILLLLLLRQANLRHLGNSLHLHHQCNPHIPKASSQKGANTLTSSETSGSSPTSKTVFAFVIIFFFNKEQSLKA